MSKGITTHGDVPSPREFDGSFEEWVEENRRRLEAHAESDYPTAEEARAFLDYVDGGDDVTH